MAAESAQLRELTRAVRGLSAGADRYRRAVGHLLGLSNSAVLAMSHLHLRGPLTPRALATDLALTTGSITALVDRLCAVGYAERNAHPHDRRSLLVQLTAKGHRGARRGLRGGRRDARAGGARRCPIAACSTASTSRGSRW